MEDPISRLLQQILEGKEELRKGLRIEKRVIAGTLLAGDLFECDERIAIDWEGALAYSISSSFWEEKSYEIGDYSGRCSPEEFRGILKSLATVDFEAPPLFSAKVGETTIRTKVEVGGKEGMIAAGPRVPESIAPLKPFFREIKGLVRKCRTTPEYALQLGLELDPPAKPGAHKVDVTARFKNNGTGGIWIAHPAGPRSEGLVSLSYGKKVVVRPGITPLPMKRITVPLRPSDPVKDPVFWIPPGGEGSLRFQAPLSLEADGEYVCWMKYANYREESLESDGRFLLGSVYSNKFEWTV